MNNILPWHPETDRPLMLAPMQGVTNRALRDLFAEWAKPDIMFTEFIRVRPGSRKAISPVDRLEAGSVSKNIPLVVQLIGKDTESLIAAAKIAQEEGAIHLNLNLGCPFGRMNSGSAGGALLKHSEGLEQRLENLRKCTKGSLSVKVRSGFDDPEQIFSLLPIFENSGIDFIVLHPRTVVQKYSGLADHNITAKLVKESKLPVIANGDVTTSDEGQLVLEKTRAAGLMIGRGAIKDPLIFQRMIGTAPRNPSWNERSEELQYYIFELLSRYQKIFEGESQVLSKLKAIFNMLKDDPLFDRQIRRILRAKSLDEFAAATKKLADFNNEKITL